MKNEVISYDVKCISKGNVFDPILFTSEKLIEQNVVKHPDEIRIAHPGELVSYFRLKNESTIRVSRNELSISTKNLENSEDLFDSIKMIYQKSRINRVELNLDEHFTDPSFPKSVFDKFVTVDGLELDVFRYKKDDMMFLLYNCHPSQMHLKIEDKTKFKKSTKFGELNFQEIVNVNAINEKREIFIDSFLKQ